MPKKPYLKEKIIGISIISLAIVFLVLVVVLIGFNKPRTNGVPIVKIPNELVMGTITKSEFDLSKYPDPNKVAMVGYESTLELQELVNGYENYLNQNGWQIVKNQEIEDVYFMFAQNRDNIRTIQITIRPQELNNNLLQVLITSREN